MGTKYYYAGSVRVAVRVGTVLDYLFSDHLGSTSITADSAGNLAGGMRYTAFGETRFSGGATPTTFRYTGQRQAEAGLYFYVARWYDPALGRWTQPDSMVPGVGNPQAYDRYAYSRNNPLNYTDPTGHWPEWLDYGLGAAYQFVNDMALNVPDTIIGTDWQEDQSAAFQSGQKAGRTASNVVGVAIAVDGAKNVVVGMSSIPPTIGAGVVCSAASGGACALAAAPAVAGEASLAGVGALEATYGTGIALINNVHGVDGPRYTSNNFRRNLENYKAKPSGMSGTQAHHMLPQQFESIFNKMGVNINDPQWGAWVDNAHQAWSKTYNADWEAWLNNNPNATFKEIQSQAQQMAQSYGISWP